MKILPLKNDDFGATRPFVRAAIQSCAPDSGVAAPVTAEEGRAALEAVFSVYKAQETGRAVRTAALRLE